MEDTIVYPRFRWLVLSAACITYISLCNQMAFPPVLPDIAKSLGIGMAQANDFLFAPILMASVSLIFVSGFVDRYGIMPCLVAALLFSGVPAVLMPIIGYTYTMVLTLRSAAGIAAGFAFCVMAPIIGTWFPLKEKGLAAGLMGGCVAIGAIGVVLAPIIAQATGSWQSMIAWLTVPVWIGLVVTLVGWAKQPKPPVRVEQDMQADSSAYKRALAMPLTWVGVSVAFFAAWVMQCLFNLTPAYFAAGPPIGVGFGSVQAGALMLPVMIAGIVGPVVAGLLQDKVFGGNSKPVMLIGFALSAVFIYFILVPTVYTNRLFLVTSLVLSAAGMQFANALIAVYVSRVYPLSISGKMAGLWMGVGMFGGTIGVGLARVLLAHTGSYYTSLVMTALAGVAGVVLTSFLKQLKGHGEQAAAIWQ